MNRDRALVADREYVHHFNIATQNIRSTRDFLANVCAQLIVHYGLEYNSLPPDALEDSSFLSQLLVEVKQRDPGKPIVILVDALDEAEVDETNSAANRLYLPPAVPTGVYFVVSTREEHDIRLNVDFRKDIYLRDDDPRNQKDIRNYIRNFLMSCKSQMMARLEVWGVDEEEFIDIICEKSQGNFMYLVHILADIRYSRLDKDSIEDIHKLPIGLLAYYQRHWRIMKYRAKDRFARLYQPVICILAVVREPVTASMVAEWIEQWSGKIPIWEVTELIHEWRQFLNMDYSTSGDPLYRIYHTSFQEFLQKEIGLREYHQRIGDNALAKIPGWSEQK